MKILSIIAISTMLFFASSCKKDDVASAASITILSCSSVSFDASAFVGTAYNATATVPYAGGNSATYTVGTAINSTGVTGLTATLQAGTLTSGTGNLSYTISGTPATTGTANFAISFGGQDCSISLTVGTPLPVPAIYSKIYGATSITNDGTWITIRSTGLPDHKSIYYPTSNPLYENFSGTTFSGYTFAKNPNTIATFNYTFKIPLNPTVAATHAATPMGPMGISLNGVPFFNQYAAGGAALSGEIVSFDQGYGHPQPQGGYHYHVEPIKLTAVHGTNAFLGFLLDGFPVYGPMENGVAATGLDVYHGHTSVTADYTSGIYHYHFSSSAPYLNGNGFYGTAGTVTY